MNAREAAYSEAVTAYFKANPQLDSDWNRRIFYGGFCKGYETAPPAQQAGYTAGDMASAAAQGFRDGVASVTQQPQKLEDIEQYRMQMAGISTAAIGYWKEGDSIHPDYDTLALRDVAKLYAKYDALYKTQQPQAEQALKDALYALQVPHVACQDGLVARCMCRKCVVKRGDEALSAPQQAEAVPLDNETKTMKLMGLVDDLIEADPDRAERFIETVLGRNALQKRLKQAQSKEPQAEAVPPGFEVWLRTVCFQRPTPEAYDLAKAAWRAAIAQQKGQP